MNEQESNASGRRVARFTLILTLVVSIIANVTHSVLAISDISLWLRVPSGVVWPIFSFLAIEIVVRIHWRRRWTHVLARVFILGPAVPAIITSYDHQRNLLIMMGESEFVSIIAPLAIDGLMIGCTLALLFTRSLLELPPAPEVGIEIDEAPPAPGADAVIEEAEHITREAATPAAPARATSGRGSEAVLAAVRALQDGQSTAEVVELTGLSAPAVRKYAAVIRTLRENPHAAIDARRASVRADVVASIRAWAGAA